MKFERGLLLLVPAAIYLFVLPIAHTTGLRNVAFALSVLLLAALLVMAWRRGTPPPPLPLKWVFGVWLVLALLSLSEAIRPDYSIREIKGEIVYGFLTFALFFRMTRGERDLHTWFGVLLASAVVVSVLGFIHFAQGLNPYLVGRYGGTLHFAAWLNTVFPVFIAMAIIATGWRRALVLGVTAMLLAVAYGSTSRAVWIALVAEIMVFGGLYLACMNVRPEIRRMVLVAGLILAVIFSGALLYITKEKLHSVHGRTASGPVDIVKQAIEADRRPKLWVDTLAFIEQRPLTGAGFGRMVLGPEIVAQQRDPNHSHAHNVFLNYALQLGLLGPVFIAWLFIAVGREGWKASKAAERRLRLLGIAVVTIVAGTFVQCMIEDVFVEHMALAFWAMTGMILGYAQNRDRPTAMA
jgi:O-antigen ligase